MKKLFFMVALLAMAVGCATQKPETDNDMKTERLTYFSFDHHNSMAMSGEKYKVTVLKDGRVNVVIDEGYPEEREFFLDDLAILDELMAVVKTYKMDKYKSDYKPLMQVFDGDSWSLYYKYDSGRNVSSGGYMAWPDNYYEMRKALSAVFKKLRESEDGMLLMDYFKFTSKNKQGLDIEYIMERGETEATVTLRNSERGVDSTFKVSNDYLKVFQQQANAAQLKSRLYDYYTEDEAATRSTYFVRYSNGDTLSGITCHTQYPSNKVGAILEFFSRWLPQ